MPLDSDNIMSAPAAPLPPAIADDERERLHRQMLSSVSHDLKTPLASIIGSLEVYERMNGRLTQEQQHSLIDLALQEAYRLDNFITNILDMARLENGLVKRRQEPVFIRGLLEDCITRLGHRLKDSQVSFDASEETQPSLKAVSDPTLLGRAICLVLDNAVKYGGSPSVIHIDYGRKDGGEGYIRITDNGPGIPAERRDAVFSKYTRFARGDQQNAGTGLGLAICREIMRLLGGCVTAESDPGGGAAFVMKMPVTE